MEEPKAKPKKVTYLQKAPDVQIANYLRFALEYRRTQRVIAAATALKKNGGAGYAQTLTVFVPRLRTAGVPEATLRQILFDNPRRFLSFVPKA